MAKKKLLKSKSNFTLRRMHQSGNYGNIYERDYTTIVSSPAKVDGQIPIYNSPSFKLTIRAGLNGKKKYSYGNWETNPNSCYDSNKWTLGCMPLPNKKSSKILLKPNSHRLTDFACYGSSTELIRASLTDIVSKYPAELFITDKKLLDLKLFDEEKDNGSVSKKSKMYQYIQYWVIDNPMFIDIIQNEKPDNSCVSDLRYLYKSFNDYVIVDSNLNEYEINTYEVILENDKNCIVNGDLLATIKITNDNIGKYVEYYGYVPEDIYIPNVDSLPNEKVPMYDYFFYNKTRTYYKWCDGIEIYAFYYGNDIIYISNRNNFKIRPKKNIIDDFFENLDDFEKVLLNRETDYTSIFETYKEDEENGWFIVEKSYKWPVALGGWNLSINGISYSKYINDLTNLALSYDELYTNSIWRDMTHEAIINMDLTSMDDEDKNSIGNTKINQVLNIIGRQFDEIKKYIDNIKNTNTITYSQDNNTPDYFLSDKLELSGWETKEILNGASENIISDKIYDSRNIGFSASQANNELMRRLFLNSKNILSKKGTKIAIEELMGVFGFHSTDYINRYNNSIGCESNLLMDYDKSFRINEYVYVADGYANNINSDELIENVKKINQLKDTFDIENINDPYSFMNEYQGLPIAEATFENKTRLIPWFDKNSKYDSKLYYQNNGGWGLYSGYECYQNVSITEFQNDLGINYKPSALTKDYQTLPITREGEGKKINNKKFYYFTIFCKYAIASKSDNPYYIWDDNESKYINIDTKPSDMTELNTLVSPLSSISFRNKQYNIFKWKYKAINKYDYTISKSNFVSKLDNLFEVPYQTLNEGVIYYVNDIKTYYKLVNINEHNNLLGWDKLSDTEIEEIINIIENNKGNNPHIGTYDNGNLYLESYGNLFKNSTFNNVREDEISNNILYGFNITRQSDSTKCIYFGDNNIRFDDSLRIENGVIIPYDLFAEKSNIYNEQSSLSIINSKELHITFDSTYRVFIENDVLPYLKQIIPSTTIFSFSFEKIDGNGEPYKAESRQVVCDGGICPIYGVV